MFESIFSPPGWFFLAFGLVGIGLIVYGLIDTYCINKKLNEKDKKH